jgi:hypothetical protein
MAADGMACDFCGHVAPPRKSAAQRLAEFAGLAGGLGVVMALCALVGHLTGI